MDTKTCPRCAEEIKAAALICRYCGHEFQARPVRMPRARLPGCADKTVGCLVVIITFFVMALLDSCS